jgi:excinuclease ABC subunit B
MSARVMDELDNVAVYPAKHFITTPDKLKLALQRIEEELQERLTELKGAGRDIEAYRLEQRTRFDMEMLQEIGYCKGIENYSRHISGRAAGNVRPCCLIIFRRTSCCRGRVPRQYPATQRDVPRRRRKENLVEFGFRLPSALDNRPLYYEEFDAMVPQAVYISATPSQFERDNSARIVELIIRPTGLVDPPVIVKPAQGQIDDLLEEIKKTTAAGYRTLVTTLTKKMSEDLTDYLAETGIKSLPALRDRDHRAGGDPARPARRGVRCARRHQPAPRRPRSARSGTGRHP